MEETFKTGQISNVGGQHQAPAKRYYSSRQKQPKPQFSKLRQGEIVQGRIIKVTGYQSVLVHLPIGNFHAEIHGKLVPGDELFLLVVAITPNLILRVYSVSAVKNKELREVNDIIRILDLPDSKEFLEAVKIAILFENTIVRDEILTILRQYASLSKVELANYNLQSIFEQLWKFKISGIDFDEELFLNTLPFAARFEHILYDLKILFERSNFVEDFKIPNEGFTESSIQKYFKRLIFIIKLFLNGLQESFIKFYQNDESLVNASKKVQEFLLSMFIQNTLFYHQQYIFQFIAPFIYKNEFKVLLFTCRVKSLNLQEKTKIRLKIDSSGYFDVYEYLYDMTISGNLKSYEPEVKYNLPDNVMNFINYIMSLPIIVEKILLLKDEGTEEIYSGNIQTPINKSISVVL